MSLSYCLFDHFKVAIISEETSMTHRNAKRLDQETDEQLTLGHIK